MSPAGKLATTRSGLLLLALAVAHLAFSYRVNPPGYLTFDSGTYHYMVRTLATTGGFVVGNGYEEFPSPALEVAQLRIHDGQLLAQYPEFLSVVGYPFYQAFGYPGLLLLNAVAFLGINALIFALARLLFGSVQIGYLGIIVYTFGTFAWEYSQSSYPHLSSTFFVLTSYYLVALAAVRRRGGDSVSTATVLLAAGAGLFAGLGVGLRLDAAFAIPGLFVALFFAGRVLLPELVALTAGLVPGFLFLSIVNSIKFDTWSPFSYGVPGSGYASDLKWYLPISLAAVVLGIALLALRYLPAVHRPRILLILASVLVLASLIRPSATWDFLNKLADGTYQIVVDLRIRGDIKEPALTRTDSGAMVYMDGVKKSLLQSCPYLVMLPFILMDAARRRRDFDVLLFLCLVPVSFVTYYSYLAWHGSIALNMRYLNPILPFTSILAAYTWDRVRSLISTRVAWLFSVMLLGSLLLLFAVTEPSLEEQNILYLTTPLLIAAAIIVSEVMRRTGRMPSVLGPAVCYLLLTAFAWSGAVAFGEDYPTSTKLRRANLDLANVIRPHIRDDSLIVSDMTDCCWKLIDEVQDLRIADSFEDEHRSFRALVRFHLEHGRPVYLAYSTTKLEEIVNGGLLNGFRFRVIDQWVFLGRPELVLCELRTG